MSIRKLGFLKPYGWFLRGETSVMVVLNFTIVQGLQPLRPDISVSTIAKVYPQLNWGLLRPDISVSTIAKVFDQLNWGPLRPDISVSTIAKVFDHSQGFHTN
jgi:hypothetical protein